MRYHVEVRPYGSSLTLYMTRRPRQKHAGPFTESFKERLVWRSLGFAKSFLEADKERGPNKVHGRLSYRIIEEPGE